MGDRRILSHFGTSNTFSALERLRALAPDAGLGLEGGSFVRLPIGERIRLATKVLLICNFRKFSIHAKSGLVDQAMFFLFLASYVFCGSIVRKNAAKSVIVANDHSPVPCGFLAAADKEGATLGFVQHAQVSESFPPLKFNVAFLFGARSARVYQRKGSTNAVVLVGSGKRGNDTSQERLQSKLHNVSSIGIALTNISPGPGLIELIDWLRSGLKPDRIFIRPHPAYSGDLTASLLTDVEISDKPIEVDAAEADLFVCGNSSVALEILLCGTPVTYYDELDAIEHDYYEFVSNGVIPEISIDQPIDKDHIVNHYSGKWREKAIDYDLSFAMSDERISRRVENGLKMLLNKESCAPSTVLGG